MVSMAMALINNEPISPINHSQNVGLFHLIIFFKPSLKYPLIQK